MPNQPTQIPYSVLRLDPLKPNQTGALIFINLTQKIPTFRGPLWNLYATKHTGAAVAVCEMFMPG